MNAPRFKVGDKLVVTGDTEGASHAFTTGTEVEVERIVRQDIKFKQQYYYCRHRQTGIHWWVYEADLEHRVEPVTDKELAEALRSLTGTPAEISEPEANKSEVIELVCGCCQESRPMLPYHHDNHNPPYDGYDYCQVCWDQGCGGPSDCSIA